MQLSKQDIIDLVDFCEDHIKHFDAVPLEFETSDGRLVPYAIIWEIGKHLLPLEG